MSNLEKREGSLFQKGFSEVQLGPSDDFEPTAVPRRTRPKRKPLRNLIASGAVILTAHDLPAAVKASDDHFKT